MLTILAILIIAAIVIAIMSAVKAWPLWVAVLLLGIVEALHYLPGGIR